MAWDDIIPEIWSARVIGLLGKIQTAMPIVNTSFTGDISEAGDVVHISAIDEVDLEAYTGADVTNQTLAPTDTTLTVDQAQAFSFRLPRLETRQARADTRDAYISRAAYRLANHADAYIYGLHASAGADSFEDGVSAAWTVGTGAAEIPNLYASLLKQAEEADIPTSELVFVAPPTVREALNIFFATRDSSVGADIQRFGAGSIGNYFGLNTVISNNLTSAAGTTHGFLFPRGDGIGYAQSILEIKEESLENNFGTNMLGLYVYGSTVYRSDVVIDVNLADVILA